MAKHKEDSDAVVPMKKSRFSVLADYDDGNTAGSSESAIEKIQDTLKPKQGRRPIITLNRAEPSMNDITRLCHSFVVNNDIRRPGWLKLDDLKQPGQLVFARINCTIEQLLDEEKQSKFVNKFFNHKWIPVKSEVSNQVAYWDQLLRVKVAKRDQLREFFQKEKDSLKELSLEDSTKLALLTTIEDMANFGYPLPCFKDDDVPGIPFVIPTKEKYTRVTKDSPIYVLDCEMCVTELNRSEITRVTLITEDGSVLIDSFVKPINKITDYVTCYSGVAEESLKNVSTQLTDIQEAFRRILPPDAILCAHSIENDLKALRMSHPYCIDVGSAYKMHSKKCRSSLRALMYYYFNEKIQSSGMGHCSYEDAWAALRLLKLKLDNGILFGNVLLGFDYVKWATEQKFHDCVQFFLSPSSNWIAKEPYQEIKLPEPREIGQCVVCKGAFMSQCQLKNCLCVERVSKYCCLCVGKDTQFAQSGEESFNFGNAVSILSKVDFTPPIKDVLKKYKKRHVMVARYLDGNVSEPTDANFHVFNMSDYGSLGEIENKVFNANILAHDLCLMEYNAEKLGISEMDNYLKALYDRISNNGVFGVLFCSPTKSILYFNVKTLWDKVE